ncbi:MAG TPA: N-acetyltransferase [Lachnoclostridium sp.]|jgi:RimJ/RimL family protein N-acetyltransferase|uniref:GNAT family N-acetyltransferase n=1 Tax=Lacrimispora sp. TaxID=2719234 RepID=UPI000EEB2137|nr:GNAT family N-acetyltransferase [Lacrimispora sp.]HCD42159.1 N-acetyltransferase [Lachnoclostridium sp.]
MIWEREITVEGKIFQVTISDNHEALRSAFAEGRAVVGLWDRERADQNLAPAAYVVENLEDLDDAFIERVVRRRAGLPWNIAKTQRLTIREFVPQDFTDIPYEPEAGKPGAIFLKEETLKDYIRHQYVFYEYGIWAVVDHVTGRLVGKAGITNLELTGQEEFLRAIKNNDTPVELGYHIFSPYRQQGYGKEACMAILSYAALAVSERIYARIDEQNLTSIKLAEDLGFRLIARTHSGSVPRQCLYEWNCS